MNYHAVRVGIGIAALSVRVVSSAIAQQANPQPTIEIFEDRITLCHSIDELYVIEKVWPNTRALATAVSPEDGATYPVVWTHEYKGARVFGTTIGHTNETFDTNQFKELVIRGFRWALKKEPIALPPPPEPQSPARRARISPREPTK